MIQEPTALTQDDLCYLFGIKRGTRRYVNRETEQAKIEGENAWLDGLNADANPYAKGTNRQQAWYSSWLTCNKNC